MLFNNLYNPLNILVSTLRPTPSLGSKFADEEVWDLMARITKTSGPILLLLRLADANAPTLSKLKGTVD